MGLLRTHGARAPPRRAPPPPRGHGFARATEQSSIRPARLQQAANIQHAPLQLHRIIHDDVRAPAIRRSSPAQATTQDPDMGPQTIVRPINAPLLPRTPLMGLTEEERQARVRQIQADKAKEAAEREAVKRRIAEDNVRAPRAALRRARIHVLTSPEPAGGAAPAAGARDCARRRGGGRRWAFIRSRLRGRGAGRRRAAARDRGRWPRASRRVQGG